MVFSGNTVPREPPAGSSPEASSADDSCSEGSAGSAVDSDDFCSDGSSASSSAYLGHAGLWCASESDAASPGTSGDNSYTCVCSRTRPPNSSCSEKSGHPTFSPLDTCSDSGLPENTCSNQEPPERPYQVCSSRVVAENAAPADISTDNASNCDRSEIYGHPSYIACQKSSQSSIAPESICPSYTTSAKSSRTSITDQTTHPSIISSAKNRRAKKSKGKTQHVSISENPQNASVGDNRPSPISSVISSKSKHPSKTPIITKKSRSAPGRNSPPKRASRSTSPSKATPKSKAALRSLFQSTPPPDHGSPPVSKSDKKSKASSRRPSKSPPRSKSKAALRRPSKSPPRSKSKAASRRPSKSPPRSKSKAASKRPSKSPPRSKSKAASKRPSKSPPPSKTKAASGRTQHLKSTAKRKTALKSPTGSTKHSKSTTGSPKRTNAFWQRKHSKTRDDEPAVKQTTEDAHQSDITSQSSTPKSSPDRNQRFSSLKKRWSRGLSPKKHPSDISLRKSVSPKAENIASFAATSENSYLSASSAVIVTDPQSNEISESSGSSDVCAGNQVPSRAPDSISACCPSSGNICSPSISPGITFPSNIIPGMIYTSNMYSECQSSPSISPGVNCPSKKITGIVCPSDITPGIPCPSNFSSEMSFRSGVSMCKACPRDSSSADQYMCLSNVPPARNFCHQESSAWITSPSAITPWATCPYLSTGKVCTDIIPSNTCHVDNSAGIACSPNTPCDMACPLKNNFPSNSSSKSTYPIPSTGSPFSHTVSQRNTCHCVVPPSAACTCAFSSRNICPNAPSCNSHPCAPSPRSTCPHIFSTGSSSCAPSSGDRCPQVPLSENSCSTQAAHTRYACPHATSARNPCHTHRPRAMAGCSLPISSDSVYPHGCTLRRFYNCASPTGNTLPGDYSEGNACSFTIAPGMVCSFTIPRS
ncbi:serine/arginine repetitive matrix protein 5-like [Ambystoma mexicanum]|uniref:serine/arginine repetitive matrix protein 5-like n=1 Tax=Ambystoma mexicanum TaxID=8296 RepID=UPI0037E7E543